MGQREDRLRNFFLTALSFLLPVAIVIAQEPTPLWTDTIRSAAGNFAVNIDPESRSVNIIRSDDRDGSSPQLRVQIQRGTAPSKEISLHAVEKPGAPLRYVGHDNSWDGAMTGFRVEFSFDGKSWKTLAPRSSP